ncbi:MAG: D-alanyl-D-alanine carboxypeptidase, partial [Longimicrobiales bacterium]
MRFSFLLVPAVLVQAGCATGGAVVAPAPVRPSLTMVIDSITSRPPLHRTSWGILVQDAATGRVLYAQNRQRNFIPASNTKLA